MDQKELKLRAIQLEQELQTFAAQSVDIAKFAEYPPLVSAIKRAKAEEITAYEEIPGMRYWMYETNIPAFTTVELAFSRFSLLLSGWIV